MAIDTWGSEPGKLPNIFVPGHGPTHAKLMMVGEAPARNEIRRGIPFIGPAGEHLTHVMARAKLPPRDMVYISNIIKVPAIDNEDEGITENQIREWEWMLHEELNEIRPRVVASLGAWSTKWFLRNYSQGAPNTTDLDWLHGIPRVATAPWGEFLLVPCFHPAAGLHDSDSIPKIHNDLVALSQVLAGIKKPPVSTIERKYFWDDKCLFSLITDSTLHIAVDTESIGLDGEIKLISYSTKPGTGYVIRDRMVMIRFANWLQHFHGTIIMHNMPHDLRILGQVGLNSYGLCGSLADTMVLAKYFNTEPGGLKALVWRHIGLLMNEYADIVRPIQRRFAVDYMNMLNSIEYPKAEGELVWKNGSCKVSKPWNLNRRINRIITDIEKDPDVDILDRWEKIPEKIRAAGVDIFGSMPIAHLDHVDPNVAKMYSGQDADVTLELYFALIDKLQKVYGEGTFEKQLGDLAMVA